MLQKTKTFFKTDLFNLTMAMDPSSKNTLLSLEHQTITKSEIII